MFPLYNLRVNPGLRIGAVAERTGLPPVTIRAWQRRYGVLEPRRTAGGHRLFSEHDVEVLAAVRALEARGYALPAAVAEVRRRAAAGLPLVPTDEHGAGGTDEQRAALERPGPSQAMAAAVDADQPDVQALLAAYACARALLAGRTPMDLVAALTDLVLALGGELGPAAHEGGDVVPIDIGLGVVGPLLPRAEPFSVGRMRVESLVPALVGDARRMLSLLDRADC